jgi:hypothetical protein
MPSVRDRERGRPLAPENDEEFIRIPGLFRRFELEQIINFDDEFRYEPSGATAEGAGLISIFHRPKPAGGL